MKPLEKRPLSGTNIRSFWPGLIRPERNSSSSMMYGEAEPLAAIIERRGLKTDDIDWFLPHLSSHYFVEPVAASLAALGLPIPRERWFSNLATKGNTGSASPYIMLDELFRSGRIKPGQKLLMFVPESGRFSSGFIYLEAV